MNFWASFVSSITYLLATEIIFLNLKKGKCLLLHTPSVFSVLFCGDGSDHYTVEPRYQDDLGHLGDCLQVLSIERWCLRGVEKAMCEKCDKDAANDLV